MRKNAQKILYFFCHQIFGFHNSLFTQKQKGNSLLSVVIAAGIMITLSYQFASFMIYNLKAMKQYELKSDKEAAKRLLISSVSCADSLPYGSCKPGSNISIKRRSKISGVKTVIENYGTKFGSYTLKAECSGSGDGIVIKAARLAKNGNVFSKNLNAFVPDPLTQKIATWESEDSLVFPQGFELCAGGGEDAEMNAGWMNMNNNCTGSMSTYKNSPEQECRNSGFRGFMGPCKGTTNLGTEVQGNLAAMKSNDNNWYWMCSGPAGISGGSSGSYCVNKVLCYQ